MIHKPLTQIARLLFLNRLPILIFSILLWVVLWVVFWAVTGTISQAAEPTPIFYESSAQKIIKAKCVRCHNPKTKKAGLDLSTAQGILAGSESGRIVQAGDPEASLLFQMIEAEEMPPDEKDHLSKNQLESLRHWIAGGAKFREAVSSAPAVTQHDIVPLLYLRCVACHGGRRQEAGLDLRTKESILKGGKSGPALVSGKPEESLIIQRIKSGEMPPRRKLVSVSVKPMEANELDLLSQWITLQLPEQKENPVDETRLSDSLVSDKDREFWSFQPPAQVQLPQVKQRDKVKNPIDALILHKLEARGLTLAPTAGKRTLIRRLYFDLTGLPPTPNEINLFLNDTDPLAYEKLVDRLLASPRYGERWARHWLDVAGYADSEGAQNQDKVRPHMYRYRDYVIRAFNQDKPYSRFLMEQIAGDELVDYQSKEITQEAYDCLVATGFLRTAPDRTFANITNFVPDRLEVISDEMDILGSAVMGLTLKCARCHSHKFDPIPQRDYYRLTAIFKEAYDEHDWLKSQGPRTLSHVMPEERSHYENHEKQLTAQVEQIKQALNDLTAKTLKVQREKKIQTLPDMDRKQILIAFSNDKSLHTAEQTKLLKKHEQLIKIAPEELKKLNPEYQQMSEKLQTQIKTVEAKRMSEPRIRALWSRGSPSPSYILKRGNYLTPGRPVKPGVPAVLTKSSQPFGITTPDKKGKPVGPRLAFAQWLTQPDNPLTARVIVNRIWLHHFGRGIVNTPGNFGHAGERPSHPELLDWLANEFVRQDWSLKALHRLMVTSNTYRQSSVISEQALRLDPDGRLFSRMPLKRMEGEVLRDTLLYLSGQLDETPFGPADPVEVRPDGLVTSKRSDRGWRRSIYVLQRRTQIPTLLDNFDSPQMGPNCLRRGESLVAPQALHLMNDQMVHQLAVHFANQIQKAAGTDLLPQVRQVYLKSFGRNPTAAEEQIGVAALKQLAAEWRETNPQKKAQTDITQKALVNYCHAIFNLAEFQYID
ncbi:PSD1 and planctomycete cytochrome C domain-containing protein [uncultured Gimesia sp.]|uniref:PSD1 and planctomycete cytochrome C domain-containing protein n=1 Tax=uncultured Gimesia sp. TaxID=1678688 RepID=UPI0030D8CAC2|tara:strand:- start:11851 stop:14823 length:2973 start_codon:yes stop_codon:yes gene_type:complete